MNIFNELNINKFNEIIHKINVTNINLSSNLNNFYLNPYIKSYINKQIDIIKNNNINFSINKINYLIEDFEYDFDVKLYNILSIYIIIISQIHIILENNLSRKNDDYILTICLMYIDLFEKEKIIINNNNLFLILCIFDYLEEYKYNNISYNIYKKLYSLYINMIENKKNNIDINNYFQRQLIKNDIQLNYQFESFLL